MERILDITEKIPCEECISLALCVANKKADTCYSKISGTNVLYVVHCSELAKYLLEAPIKGVFQIIRSARFVIAEKILRCGDLKLGVW